MGIIRIDDETEQQIMDTGKMGDHMNKLVAKIVDFYLANKDKPTHPEKPTEGFKEAEVDGRGNVFLSRTLKHTKIEWRPKKV